jgi:hypothetical protein
MGKFGIGYEPKKDAIYLYDNEKEKLLASTNVQIIAISEKEDKCLLHIGKNKKVICKMEELASKNDLTRLLSPSAYFASTTDHEHFKIYLMAEYRKQPTPLVLVDLSNIFGRYVDDCVDMWIVDGWVFAKGQKPQPIPNDKTYNLILDGRVYHLDISDISRDLLPRITPPLELLPINNLIMAWRSVYKNETILLAVLGYFAACMYMPEVIKARTGSNFPLLGIIGTTAMGKTALLQALYQFWGMDFRPSNYPLVSQHVELVQLCQASCFPIWRDEFRNEKHALLKEGNLRSLYDRTPINKGMANQGLKNWQPLGTLLLTGEDIIIDPALRRRFVIFQLHETYKLPLKQWEEARCAAEQFFPQLFTHFLNATWSPAIFARIMGKKLFTDNSESEEKTLYAALGAVLGIQIGEEALDLANAHWEKSKENGAKLTTRLSSTEEFFDFLQNFLTTKGMYTGRTQGNNRVPSEISKFIRVVDDTEVKIYLQGLIDLAYKNGFAALTNLGAPALRTMIYDYFDVISTSIRIDKWVGKA